MILVTTGTHEQPFDRLVRAAEDLAIATGEEVVVQRGPSEVPTPSCTSSELLPHRELLDLMARARVVVTHAGPASILEAAVHGVPVVVPRSPAHGEHVDDHQQRFADRIAHRVHLVRDPADLVEAVARHEGVAAGLALAAGAGHVGVSSSIEAFARAVEGLLDPGAGRRRGLLRATVQFVKTRKGTRRP